MTATSTPGVSILCKIPRYVGERLAREAILFDRPSGSESVSEGRFEATAKFLIRLGGSGARGWRCTPSRPLPAIQRASRRPLWRMVFDGSDAKMPNSQGVRGGQDRREFQS